MRGTVKFYIIDKGYGFIAGDDGCDYHFTKACLPRARRYDPVEGDTVEFDTRQVAKGMIAHHIDLDPDRKYQPSLTEKEASNALHDVSFLRSPTR